MATFGELTSLASEYLSDLQKELCDPHIAQKPQISGFTAELARLSHVLHRYQDQIATGFGAPESHDTGVRDAARRASDLIKQAERLLGPPATSEIPDSPLAEKIRSASIALGCGLDVLWSHFQAPARTASESAAIIAESDTARSLLHQLTEHIATAGNLAGHAPSPSNHARELLLKAADLSRVHGKEEAPAPISAVPLRLKPNRLPPTLGEDTVQSLVGIRTTIQRLDFPVHPPSVATWRYLARAAAITCDINAKIINQLLLGTKEHRREDITLLLQNAAKSLDHTSRRWRVVVRNWDKRLDHCGHPNSEQATDASDLIVRLGRLIHTDPAWTPGPRSSYRVKPPEEVAPNALQAARIGTAALLAIEGCNAIARHPGAAINDAAVLGKLERQRKPTANRWDSSATTAARRLLSYYETATSSGLTAITTLGRAVQAIAPTTYEGADEVALLIRQATRLSEANQYSAAAADFPTPANSNLSVATTSKSNSRQPRPSPRRSIPKT
ncbi:hypothetical protein Acsp04_58590 [Actinomadura sp. NBRC 104425]|uniref:hypothetical protein n=1 Tax=Actinomadura sp. NBRC 104425 TaxID=3032204 RepID=UPI0024A45E51|nr:hypothetical protein [Actinomadura sp. NBRC 104425]GLZ15624.1 hypothetical protein Acsp04_58590 [Actinomadura sp. NBRC 104425]